MRYPNGHSINVGDHVWWNEGVCIGYIEHVIETDEQIDSWGLSEPSIGVSNLHPFEIISQKHPQKIGDVSLGGTVVYASSDLADEGVGPLSASEEMEFTWAVSQAICLIPESDRSGPFCVTAQFDAISTMEHWHFHFLDHSGSTLHHVMLPFRPGTRLSA